MFMFVASAIADPTRTQLRLATLRLWVEAAVALARQVSEDLGRDLIGGARLILRLSRGVRLALALHARLCDPTDPRFQPRPVRARAARAGPPEAEIAPCAPRRSGEAVRPRRRGGPSAEDAILRRPLVEVVRVICRALGVTPDWSLWSDETEAQNETQSETQTGTGARSTPIAADPPPHVLGARPAPGARPQPVPTLPPRPPVAEPLRARLRRSCSPLALIPIVAPTSGRGRLPGS